MIILEKTHFRETVNRICIALILSLALGYLLSHPVSEIIGALPEAQGNETERAIVKSGILALYYCIYMLVPALVFVKLNGGMPKVSHSIEKRKISLWEFISVCIIAFTLSELFTAVFRIVGIAFGISDPARVPVPVSGAHFFVELIRMALLPAVVEELVFRGIIFGSLLRYRRRFAIVLSALLFCSVHTGLPSMAGSFVYGLAFAYLALRTGGIHSGMILHFINNAFALVVNYLAEKSPTALAFIGLAIIQIIIVGIILSLVFLLNKKHLIDEAQDSISGEICVSSLATPLFFVYCALSLICLVANYI